MIRIRNVETARPPRSHANGMLRCSNAELTRFTREFAPARRSQAAEYPAVGNSGHQLAKSPRRGAEAEAGAEGGADAEGDDDSDGDDTAVADEAA
jgi:CarD family transcriptional regulator